MPIGATVAAVDQALAFIGQGKLHEANLELKKATDGLVEQSDVVAQPTVASAKPADAASASQPNARAEARAAEGPSVDTPLQVCRITTSGAALRKRASLLLRDFLWFSDFEAPRSRSRWPGAHRHHRLLTRAASGR